jgi:hypothetical protein
MVTPEQLWQTLVEEAGEDAIASAASATVAQAEQELALAGFDVAAERARANERIAELTGAPASASGAGDPASERVAWVSRAPPSARRAPASRSVVWLAAALAAAAATGGILYAVAHRPKPPDKPVEGPREAPSASASSGPPPLPVAPSESPPTLYELPPGWDGKGPRRPRPVTP